MSSRRQISIPLSGRYGQVSLYLKQAAWRRWYDDIYLGEHILMTSSKRYPSHFGILHKIQTILINPPPFKVYVTPSYTHALYTEIKCGDLHMHLTDIAEYYSKKSFWAHIWCSWNNAYWFAIHLPPNTAIKQHKSICSAIIHDSFSLTKFACHIWYGCSHDTRHSFHLHIR